MAINTNNDKSIPTNTKDYYEEPAAQEEIYLEEIEEELRASLTSDDQVLSRTKAEYWQSRIKKLELNWK